jgi:hypothetical protein
MGAGGWNKGIKNSTGTAFKNKKHKPESIEKLKNRSKDVYKKPKAEVCVIAYSVIKEDKTTNYYFWEDNQTTFTNLEGKFELKSY